MDRFLPPWTLGSLVEKFGGELHGPADLQLLGVTNCNTFEDQAISFAEKESYVKDAEANQLAALIVSPGLSTALPHIVHPKPRDVFGALLHSVYKPLSFEPGIHPTAVVHDTAKVAAGANLGPFTVVGAHAVVGSGAVIHPFTNVGEECEVGEGCILFPNVTLVHRVKLGKYVVVHSGAVLGADGFGYYWDGSKRVKVPQVGSVELKDHAEVGALTAIDRATAGATVIGTGTKIDNLCQIAHNVVIGDHVVVAAKAGISGSVRIGNRVEMGGAVEMSPQTRLGDDVALGGRTVVASDIMEPGAYMGMPAMPIRRAQRVLILLQRLPEIFDSIKSIQSRVKELEDRKN